MKYPLMREQIIYYSYKYKGEYARIIKAIKDDEDYKSLGIDNCLTILDAEYPKELSLLHYPPLVIYYKGDLSLLKEDKVAIVGSRIASDYAKEATIKLTAKLNEQNLVIISGLALGIDAIAHFHAKRTIGILGSGIDYYYPRQNEKLIEECSKKHLILSEYPGLTPPLKHHFPIRNRMIAALGRELYVMQASVKSGTMTTVKHAIDLNRDVYALPYRIFDLEGEACNMLIQEGAQMIVL